MVTVQSLSDPGNLLMLLRSSGWLRIRLGLLLRLLVRIRLLVLVLVLLFGLVRCVLLRLVLRVFFQLGLLLRCASSVRRRLSLHSRVGLLLLRGRQCCRRVLFLFSRLRGLRVRFRWRRMLRSISVELARLVMVFWLIM